MSVVLNLFVALMLPGIIVRTRALLAGRKGAPFYKHISRLGALLCKAPVYSSATGFVFRLAPVVYLASTVAAMLLVPVGDFSAVLAFNGDIVLFCYLLALGRVMLILAAMETGSSIDGMGASREALYGALLEPALFLVARNARTGVGQPQFFPGFCRSGERYARNGRRDGIGDVCAVQDYAGRSRADSGGRSPYAPRTDDDS